MSLFFKAPIDIEIRLDGEESRQHVDVKNPQGRIDKLPVFKDGESVKGTVTVRTKEGKRVEHMGIKVQLLGSIETNTDSITTSEFLTLSYELAAPSVVSEPESYPFEFKNVEKQYESYRGKNVRLRYYIKVTVSRRSLLEITREKELWVYQITEIPSQKSHSLVKMDVGILDCLHIEFEYLKNRYSLKDMIVGKIYFLLARLKIKHMEISLIRREIVGAPPNQVTDSETVVRFEIMDGAPVKGETIPIRLFLAGFDLVPTYKDVNKKFSVRTYLSLVLIDEDARRYFKQSEILLYRDC